MKKILLSILSFILILFSCSNNFVNNNEKKEMGTMSIYIEGISLSNGRSVISKTYASSTSNRYDIYLYNFNEKVFIPVTNEITEISVPVGVYNLVLLAGYLKAPGYNGCLLGSAYKKNIEIKKDINTQIELSIYPISDTITAPEWVLTNETFTVKTEYTDRNPLIKLACSNCFYEYEGNQFAPSCEICSLSTGLSENNYCTFQITAPNIQTKLKITSFGRNVYLVDEDYDLNIFAFGETFPGGIYWNSPSSDSIYKEEGFNFTYVDVELDRKKSIIAIKSTWCE